jgi:hypothetical protein
MNNTDLTPLYDLINRDDLFESWADTLSGRNTEATNQRYWRAVDTYIELVEAGRSTYSASREACGYILGPECVQHAAYEGILQPVPDSQRMIVQELLEGDL